MATKLQKLLAKLDKKRQRLILQIIKDIYTDDRKHHDRTKLSGKENIYRIRKGQLRIVFAIYETGNIIINVGFRKDVYKDM